MKGRTLLLGWMLGFAWLWGIAPSFAAGTLTAKGSPEAPIKIQDHHVDVVINNGFVRTEVSQVFYNPNSLDLEAIYACPVPKSSSLSEFTIYIDERELHGEVLEKEKAKQIYEQERNKGNDAGLASKDAFQTFHFQVSPVRAQSTTRIRFVYYQPIEIDAGVGRFLYPLEDGGTDEAASSFWLNNPKVEQSFSLNLELKTAWPVSGLRLPGYESQTQITELDEGHYQVKLELQEASLNRDLVFYYRLADNLPGRVELIPYRADQDGAGTFMMVVTPGLDLKPLNHGADYVFVLDISGSMRDKIKTLAKGVSKSLGEMKPDDRFRIVLFESSARELTHDWVDATSENVSKAISKVMALKTEGGTDLHAGLQLALRDLDDDRATSIVLVTDAATNTGTINPKSFHKLMKKYDVRVFGFLLGNNANWPLMRTICNASGGYWSSVSNADDIIGQILQAKSKITYESLHHVSFDISGVATSDLTLDFQEKIYRGQQLVIFGRYARGGTVKVRLKASLTGEDKEYVTTFDLPETALDHPEIERLWAMSMIEQTEDREHAGKLSAAEAEGLIRDLGVNYQLVTDHTSMVVLSDDAFAERGIERRNQARAGTENQARSRRVATPVTSGRVDESQPMFDQPAPSTGNGGGSIDPLIGLVALFLSGLALMSLRPKP